MNKQTIFLGVALALSITSCKDGAKKNELEHVSPDIVNIDATASGEKVTSGAPKFAFEETNFDFGTINSGTEVVHVYKFKNTGDADLIISQAKGSCGCTQPEYPQNPVHPGEEGEIKVTFRSHGIAGQVVKDITLLANTSPTTKILTISGEVLAVPEKK